MYCNIVFKKNHSFSTALRKHKDINTVKNTYSNAVPATQSSKPNTGKINGQGLTEYIIILALVCVASIVAVSYFGSTVKASFVSLGADLTGAAKVDRKALVSTSQNAAQNAAQQQTTLGNYNN